MPPLEEWRRFIYCTGMGAEVLGRVDHFKSVRRDHVLTALTGRLAACLYA